MPFKRNKFGKRSPGLADSRANLKETEAENKASWERHHVITHEELLKQGVPSPKTPLVRESSLGMVRSVKPTSTGLVAEVTVGFSKEGGGVKVQAVVDTAADITLISTKLYAKLPIKPEEIRKTQLRSAAEGEVFNATVVGPVTLKIGPATLKAEIHVADICDTMLLGIDVLSRIKATLSLNPPSMTINGDQISLEAAGEAESEAEPRVSVRRVSLHRVVKVPAQSEVAVTVPVEEQSQAPFSLLEPNPDFVQFIPYTLLGKGKQVRVAILNNTDVPMTIQPGEIIGQVFPVEEEEIETETQIPGTETVRVVHGEDSTSPIEEIVKAVDVEVSPAGVAELREILTEFESVFAKSKYDLGSFSEIVHEIDTGDARPIKLGMRRTPIHFMEEEERLLTDMLNAGVIRPSLSSWAAAPVLVRKKDNTLRYAVDFRSLNACTKTDTFPIPNMGEMMDALAGNKWLSNLDANAAYWQIPMAPEAREKTAFRTRLGVFEFMRMPFGLSNGPATFSRVMELVLRGLQPKSALAFLDDIVILGTDEKSHLNNLRQVLTRFQRYGLKLKPTKCRIFQKTVQFLGRVVSSEGVTLTDHSLQTIETWAPPTSVKEVRQFLGMINFHRQFCAHMATLAAPLNQILKEDAFRWGTQQQEAFEKLKAALATPPILVIPNKTDPFILDVDCSGVGMGGQLMQLQNGQERTVAYCSFALNVHEKNYCVTRRELLALVRITNHFKHYLIGRPFEVRTDHKCLKWLVHFKAPQGQLARWLEHLANFQMTITYRPGKLHLQADALSRRTETSACPKTEQSLQSLPCGGCKSCRFQYRDDFRETVDDVGPLCRNPEVREVKSTGLTIKTANPNHQEIDWKWLEELQGQDKDMEPLIKVLRTGDMPPENEMGSLSPASKFYLLNREAFFIHKFHNVVFHDNGVTEVPVIPDAGKEAILNLCHDNPCSGHPGVENTKSKVKEKFFWYKLSRDVKQYVAGCHSCNINKKGKNNKMPRVIHQASQPMEKVHLDFLGPLPKSKLGNSYLLVMACAFTKWVEFIPLPNQEAETMARAAIQDFFSRMGYPLLLITDQGSNFNSVLFAEVCRVLQIVKARTTAYRPSANGQAERCNRSMLTALRHYINKNHDDWDIWVPLVASAIRATVNKQTGYTPNRLMLGRETWGPVDLCFPGLPSDPVQHSEFVTQLQQELKTCHELARDTLRARVKAEKRYFDKSTKITVFERGNPVFWLDSSPPQERAQ